MNGRSARADAEIRARAEALLIGHGIEAGIAPVTDRR
jgi:hypothetical protein